MIGGSYGGQVQFAAASLDPRIDALIPIITWNDLSYSLAPNNTSIGNTASPTRTPGVHKKQWTSLFFSIGIADGIQGAGGRPDPARSAARTSSTRPAWPRPSSRRVGYPTRRRGLRPARVGVVVPGEGQGTDAARAGAEGHLFNLQEAAATYRGLQAQGTAVQMIWQSWGHSLGGTPAPGELDLTGHERPALDLPRRPVPRLVQPLRQGRHRGHDRAGVLLLP